MSDETTRPLTAKDTNPKDAVGTARVPFSTVPARPLAEVGLAMLEGARKYGRHNYRVAGVRASVYYDAAMRHLTAWWEGQDIDPDSGLPHIIKAVAGLLVVRDSELQGNWIDDRPPAVTDPSWQDALNRHAKRVIAKYPNPVAAYTQKGLEERAAAEGERIEAGAFMLRRGTPWDDEDEPSAFAMTHDGLGCCAEHDETMREEPPKGPGSVLPRRFGVPGSRER